MGEGAPDTFVPHLLILVLYAAIHFGHHRGDTPTISEVFQHPLTSFIP